MTFGITWGSDMKPRALIALTAVAFMTATTATAMGSVATVLYRGKTSQDLPIAFRITTAGEELTTIDFEWKATCANGQTHEAPIELGPTRVRSGSFRISGTLNTGGHVSISGRLIPGGARGQLARSGPSDFGSSACDVSGVTWTATPTGG